MDGARVLAHWSHFGNDSAKPRSLSNRRSRLSMYHAAEYQILVAIHTEDDLYATWFIVVGISQWEVFDV